MSRALDDLSPTWVGYGGAGISDKNHQPIPERHGIGILFDCPCGCDQRCFVPFSNPIDGGPPPLHDERARWQREGETFETLSLTPSILRAREKGGCGWHGYVTNGRVEGRVE